MNALKIFLSIRPAKATGNNLFKIKSNKRKIDKKYLYYKFIEKAEKKNKIYDLKRLSPQNVQDIVQDIAGKLQLVDNKNVLFFIHGYHPFQKSLHLKLLDNLINEYGCDDSAKFGAIVFFSWPNRGLIWKEDDEAYKIGEILATRFTGIFSGLSNLCKTNGATLNLMCQSFGHHILNSIVQNRLNTELLFDKIFLMAADIPNQCLKNPDGVRIKNKVGKDPKHISYNFIELSLFCNEVHIFHDPYDVILAASKSYFLKDYNRLGMTGVIYEQTSKFINHSYSEYSDEMVMGPQISTKHPNWKIFIKAIGPENTYNTRHQYFYSNKKVVEIIKACI